jgi:hypothetical protein
MYFVHGTNYWVVPVIFPKVTTVNSDRRAQWAELGYSRPPVLYADFFQWMSGETLFPGGSGVFAPGPFPGGLTAGGPSIGTAWQANHAYLLNQSIIDPSSYQQQVTTAGTSQTPGPPAWNDSGGTTTDGGVTWTDRGFVTVPNTPLPSWMYQAIPGPSGGEIQISVFFGLSGTDGSLVDPNGKFLQSVPFDDLYRQQNFFAIGGQLRWMNF